MFQDECNWILSGRDPLPDNIEEEDENTLDDISGDEVSTLLLKYIWIHTKIRYHEMSDILIDISRRIYQSSIILGYN